ncbi:MAG: hypothetical protein JWO38_6477 [Gemmataceae bacterium]|nr:hypothetical protein [Gemmataceae bacterium]
MPHRLLSLLLASFVFPATAFADGYTPEEAVKRMKLPEGFTARTVAAEPMIRQPVSISFDAQGRMWVLQYLQYPNYAGLKPVKQDQYLRTIWDKVPEPPPHGPKGADRLTICYDPDENGVYRKSKDFVTGLNIASGFCIGNGGVYVAQPPYLLFYPDKNEDDVPDGDPEVLLTGFGMDDTHSLANSLQWGPDGWLYGAAGSTSTCKIKNPADPRAAPVEFQQGIWRFHPKTKRFELFSEGGGNTYGLDFDRHGQAIAGTNWGGFAMLHQVQGGYYVKGFSKHGPLHNPHTYGYFDHVPYAGFKGGHVTCGGILYQADTFPPQYRDQYIAANLLSNAVYWHKLEAVKSSFKASHGGDLLEANDPWFRPIDLLLGPDGSVFVVDFYDRRAAHLDPVDSWDRTNGRVYKIEYKGTPKLPAFDLRKKTSAELVQLLKHPNKWWRNEARRLLAERQDKTTYATLDAMRAKDQGEHALEAMWALYVSGGWDASVALACLHHSNEHVRAWAVRFIGDGANPLDSRTRDALATLAAAETSPVVKVQLACTAKRLPAADARAIVAGLLTQREDPADPFLTLVTWWAVEDKIADDPAGWIKILEHRTTFSRPINTPIYERAVRRLVAVESPEAVAVLREIVRDVRAAVKEGDKTLAPLVLRPIETAVSGGVTPTAKQLEGELAGLAKALPEDDTLLRILLRLGNTAARKRAWARVADGTHPEADRVAWLDVLARTQDPATGTTALTMLKDAKTDALRVGVLGAVEVANPPGLAGSLLAQYPAWSAAVKKRAVQALLARPDTGVELLKAVDQGTFPKADLTIDQARAAVGLNDKVLTALVEKHFGKLASATAGEKQARITWLNVVLSREKAGDPVRGKALFAKHCAACHQLHGEGGKVGPDLTTADRKNRGYLLAQIVDPSGYIRPEYVVHNVTTVDGRKVSGIVGESGGASVTLVNVINNQPQKTVIAKADVEAMTPSAISLMPEKLLDTLTDPEVADLFAYLASGLPGKPAPKSTGGLVPPGGKKLRVCLVSGSFEYKSDESLAGFAKYLEAAYPVECTRAFARTEKEIGGLETLETADVAVFFTRRLKIPPADLERVKKFVQSGKPVIGIRTASHGFQDWLEMDTLVFGGDYKNHYGAGPACAVTVAAAAKDHPVLKGVVDFKSNGSLYKNPNVAADVTVLLKGSIPDQSEPVAWVREKDGRRVFYTSLGHPDDFKNETFTRLLVNALAWTTKTELKPAK